MPHAGSGYLAARLCTDPNTAGARALGQYGLVAEHCARMEVIWINLCYKDPLCQARFVFQY